MAPNGMWSSRGAVPAPAPDPEPVQEPEMRAGPTLPDGADADDDDEPVELIPTGPDEMSDVADIGLPVGAAETQAQVDAAELVDNVPAPAPDPPSLSCRPPLLRNKQTGPPSDDLPIDSMPPPPSYEPPSQPQPTDSLSLQQLRNIVTKMRRGDAVAYDFAYGDMGPLAEEIDEWFPLQQTQDNVNRLLYLRMNFCHLWQRTLSDNGEDGPWDPQTAGDVSWNEANAEARRRFLSLALADIQSQDDGRRQAAVHATTYLVLGDWAENGSVQFNLLSGKTSRHVATTWQLDAMTDAAGMLAAHCGIPIIWRALVNVFECFWSQDLQSKTPIEYESMDLELNNLMTIMYMVIQVVLNSEATEMCGARRQLVSLDPPLEIFMLGVTAKLRWDESETLPTPQIYLLLWKSLMLVFGGTKEIEEAKKATSELETRDKTGDLITASPIDYHVFRQEIISKYPAYVPPKTVFPLEPDNCSLLPPLPNQQSRFSSSGIIPAPPHVQVGGASILNQPVHIATPAPSPPPSPGIGKGAKKQNYQTNQNFPFMYPPLDATSNSAGGKGGAGLQEQLVGRRWEGSDVPASILEAGRLFSERVRMTRATRQLWDERERFIKFERGWEAENDVKAGREDDDVDVFCLDQLTPEEREVIRSLKLNTSHDGKEENEPEVDHGPRGQDLDPDIKKRLDAVERFYRVALPQLQSLVIVLLKIILANIGMLQMVGHHPAAAPKPNGPGMGGPGGMNKSQDKSGQNGQPDQIPLTPEELGSYRSKEIGGKAVAGILLLLLKWFKISHIFKFEYLTQLLVDSNYLPLILKLLAHADVPQFVGSNLDRLPSSFFWSCNELSNNRREIPTQHQDEGENEGDTDPNPEPLSPNDGDAEDDAAPPPIKRRKSPTTNGTTGPGTVDGSPPAAVGRPEVDELGYPINGIPAKPITDFSRRNFFALINYLRVLQKCCKNKAHRNLLLVQYKSANILRKSLKVPQEALRLYTLKLFKNQVPYCGRKWRQSNMRVITAVYLHCRPELRDEWLAGSDVDAAIEAALPLEQALRSLTHWFNVRRYPDQVHQELRIVMHEELDFFTRELEKIHLSWVEPADDDEAAEWEHEPGWP